MRMHTHMHTHTHTCTHTHARTVARMYTYMHTHNTHMHAHTCTHTHARTHTHAHTHMHTHTHMHAPWHACTHTCTHARTHASKCVHKHHACNKPATLHIHCAQWCWLSITWCFALHGPRKRLRYSHRAVALHVTCMHIVPQRENSRGFPLMLRFADFTIFIDQPSVY